MEELLQEITNCEIIQKTLNENFISPCKKIIDSQECTFKNFQLPEPWNGDLENCKILFISSNPSINRKENYPLGNWNKSDITDFFINRFSSPKKWVKDELLPQLIGGDYEEKKEIRSFLGCS